MAPGHVRVPKVGIIVGCGRGIIAKLARTRTRTKKMGEKRHFLLFLPRQENVIHVHLLTLGVWLIEVTSDLTTTATKDSLSRAGAFALDYGLENLGGIFITKQNATEGEETDAGMRQNKWSKSR